MSAQNQQKKYFRQNIAEEKEKCVYNSGYCKYKSKCKHLHPTEECSDHCKFKSSLKRHVKQCKFGTICKRIEKCVYKNMLDNKETSHNNQVISLKRTVMELLEFKEKSEAKIKILHLEVN